MLYINQKGSVNYTIVGSPTIVDGVASGFSSSDYLTIETVPQTISSYEIGTKFTTGSGSMTNMTIIGQKTTNRHTPQLATGSSGGAKLYFSFPDSSHTFVAMNTNYLIAENTNYEARMLWDGEKVEAYLKSNNGEWEKIGESALTTCGWDQPIEIGADQGVNPLKGSIDINHTYIIVNGQPFFGICPVEVKKHQIMGPVGYTVTGSPTITDGVASGFSSSDYLKFSSILSDITQTDVEILTTLNNAGDGSAQGFGIVMSLNCVTIALTNNGSPTFTVYTQKSGETSYTGRSIYDWGIHTIAGKFVLKFTKQSNLLRIQGSRDGSTFDTGATYTLEEGEEIRLPSAVGEMMRAGRWTPLGTQLNLNETYIKVNGKLWFWQPRETERIVVNGVEVWSKPQES